MSELARQLRVPSGLIPANTEPVGQLRLASPSSSAAVIQMESPFSWVPICTEPGSQLSPTGRGAQPLKVRTPAPGRAAKNRRRIRAEDFGPENWGPE